MCERVDVLVVGAGLSGGAALARLHHLVPRSNVLVVDQGTEEKGGGNGVFRAQRESIVMRSADRYDVTLAPWWTDRRIGGAANLWYGQVARFDPIDFASLAFPRDGDDVTHSRRWPFDLATLDPYYDFVESILSPVSSAMALDPGTRLPEGWTARTRVGRAEQAIYDLLGAGGWAPFAGATCLGGHAWTADPVDQVTLAPIRLSGPAEHARNFVWHTRRIGLTSAEVRLWSDARVLMLEEHEGGLAAHISRAGSLTLVLARFVVLACGVLETLTLMRRSGLAHERLGQDFTFTTEVTAYVATEIPRDAGEIERAITRIAAVSTKRLYVPEAPGLAKGGKISAYDARGFETDARHTRKIRAATGCDPDILSPPSRLTVKLSFKGESVAFEGKQITLPDELADCRDRCIINYTPHPHDKRLVAYVRAAFEEIAALFPGGRVIAASDNVEGPNRSSAHHHGGATCGASLDLTVLDPDCSARDIPALFVADASAMPSSGATNSSLTVMANAARIVDVIAARL